MIVASPPPSAGYLNGVDTQPDLLLAQGQKKKKKRRKEEEDDDGKRDQHHFRLVSSSPTTKHKLIKESIWIDGCRSPCWLQEHAGKTGLQLLKRSIENREEEEEELSAKQQHKKKNKTVRQAKRAHYEAKKADTKDEDLLILGIANHQRREQDPSQPHVLAALLKACAKQKDLRRGSEIHADIVRTGLLEKYVCLGSTLVSMYAKCGSLAEAQHVFDKLPIQDVVLWNALISGYAQRNHGNQAVKCFEQMQMEGLSPTAITYTCTLKACGSIAAADKGKEIHAQIDRDGFLKKDLVLGNALIDMYAKCGLLEKAQEVFDSLPKRDVISWSVLMNGYAQHDHGEEALKLFNQMQFEGLFPDAFTFACILKACGSIGAVDKGKEIHDKIISEGLLKKDIIVGNALIDMYAKCGCLEQAQRVFDKLPVKDVVSWSTLMAGYAQHGNSQHALKCYIRMKHYGIFPDAVSYICILKACGNIGAIDQGREVHGKIVREGLLHKDITVGNALIDMYAKCGLFENAHEVFDGLPFRDVVSWSALMAGYALVGKAEDVFCLFDKMVKEGVEPNLVTFATLLNTCTHAGLLEKGKMYFKIMSTRYGVLPTLEHHTCMVDLFGRAGHLDSAIHIVKEMPFSADLTVWLTMLGACQKWGNMKLGKLAFEHALQLDEKDPAAYICMKNIYSSAGRQVDADKIEALRVKNQAQKKLGHCWWTDPSGTVHLFSSAEGTRSQSLSLYKKLEYLAFKLKQEGCSSVFPWASEELGDGAKRDVLCGHGEKLAIACALINTSRGTPIHVVKDTEICSDCHSATALVSKIEKRKIFVRDVKCFHVFKDGMCTCEDHW